MLAQSPVYVSRLHVMIMHGLSAVKHLPPTTAGGVSALNFIDNVRGESQTDRFSLVFFL